LSKKKLLNIEENFVDTTIKGNDNIVIDEEKQIQNDFLSNFIDPLTENQRVINFGSFEEKERNRLHLQSDHFETIYFYEKFYSQHTIQQIERSLKILKNNLVVLNFNEETLLDKNIYKYLDCKKFLDEMFDKHNLTTIPYMNSLKNWLIGIQKDVLESISALKNGFELILKSKKSKDIISRFKRYFMMKDEIEGMLKVSNFEGIADYFKKIVNEVDNISGTLYVYGDFYSYFYNTVESVKTILISIINRSISPEIIITHFRCLLKFDVESEVVDNLYSVLKDKICQKIRNFLSFSVSIEVQLVKDFFCEEFISYYKSDDHFKNLNLEAERLIRLENNFDEIEEELMNEDKSELIDVDFIINCIFNEIKEFFYMMKRIEDIALVHKFFSPRYVSFQQIIEEIYLLFFKELSDFLFSFSPAFKSNQRRYLFKCRLFKEHDIKVEEKNKLFEFYERHPDANTVFNEKLDKKRMKTVTDILIKMLNMFEEHLSAEQIINVNKLKTNFLERFFISHMNSEFLTLLGKLNDMNQMNFNDSIYTVSNLVSFASTNQILVNVFWKYRTIVKSYINIVKNAKHVVLDYDLIFLTYFFSIKTLYLKFNDLYLNEISKSRYKEKNVKMLKIRTV
jgi:hypothetical protein